ncbi:MAG TPA: class I SAM-dependent methyltransferase [Vicinamibacteria bacterium]|nr:class I SAM-dependent methyltransferase [Vicinamibacteria bacterium]
MTVTLPAAEAGAAAAQFEDVRCAVCGGDGYEVVIPSRRDRTRAIDLQTVFRSSGDEPLQDQMVRCTSCGLCYVRPRLRWELILEGYRGGTDENFVSQIAFRETTFRKCLDKIEKIAPPAGKRVLDVGAAGGSFLAMARERGYAPLGCEPSTWMCQFAREHYGLDLHPGTIFDMPVERGSVDLLTLWDVIEHTPDPKAVLARAHELLTPGGVLVMSWPDNSSGAARLLGAKWPFLLTVHLYYFTPATMTELLRRTGFLALAYRKHWQTLELGYVALRAAPYLGPLAPLLRGPIRLLGLEHAPLAYWVGQTMVVARKA